MNSTYNITGIPEAVSVGAVIITFILAIAPFASGHDFGIFKVPAFNHVTRQKLRILGPLLLIATLILFIPLWPSSEAVDVHNGKPVINLFYHKSLNQQAVAAAVGLRNNGYQVNLLAARHNQEPDEGTTYLLTRGNHLSYPPNHSDKLPEILQFFPGIPMSQLTSVISDEASNEEKRKMMNTVHIFLSGPETDDGILKP